jgi:hypothetical protein
VPAGPGVEAHQGGGAAQAIPPGYTPTLGVAEYAAYRVGTALFIKAWGTLPNFNDIAALDVAPIKIFPPQFQMLFYRPRITMPTTRPFMITEQFGFPANLGSCVVNDAHGRHIVPIRNLVDEPGNRLPDFLTNASTDAATREAVGYGASFQAAFDAAVAQLAPTSEVADQLVTYTLLKSGLIQGGIAGLNRYFCQVQAEVTP